MALAVEAMRAAGCLTIEGVLIAGAARAILRLALRLARRAPVWQNETNFAKTKPPRSKDEMDQNDRASFRQPGAARARRTGGPVPRALRTHLATRSVLAKRNQGASAVFYYCCGSGKMKPMG